MQIKNQKIQLLRGLAIIAVVLIHTCPHGIYLVIFRPFINFAVATFFFLSGYLTKTENDDWGKFYKKRIYRVVVPYVIWTILYTVTSEWWDVSTIVWNLVTAKSAGMMYYVLVYIQFVLLTPLLGKLGKSRYLWIGWLIAPVSVLIFKYYPLFFGGQLSPNLKLFFGNSCLGWFTFYYLGLLLGNSIIKVSYSRAQLLKAYLIAIVLNMIEGYVWLKAGDANCGTQLKLTSFLTSSIFIMMAYKYICSKRCLWENKWLIIIGNYSFGIYLSHMMFIKYLPSVPLYANMPFVCNSAVILFLNMILLYCLVRIFNPKIHSLLGFK